MDDSLSCDIQAVRHRSRPRRPSFASAALTASLLLSASACVSAPSLAPSGPATASLAPVSPTAAAEPATDDPATAEAARPEPSVEAERPRPDRGPTHPRFVAAHYGGGVAGSLVFTTLSYAVARAVGSQGQGLGPVIGALVIGAFAPPILNYTVAWALGRTVAPGRDRFWPGFLVRQVVHLGVFAGAVVGGVDFNKPGHFAAMVLGDAFATSGLATMTAELTRRPPSAIAPAAGSASASLYPGGRRPVEILVPVLEVQF